MLRFPVEGAERRVTRLPGAPQPLRRDEWEAKVIVGRTWYCDECHCVVAVGLSVTADYQLKVDGGVVCVACWRVMQAKEAVANGSR